MTMTMTMTMTMIDDDDDDDDDSNVQSDNFHGSSEYSHFSFNKKNHWMMN